MPYEADNGSGFGGAIQNGSLAEFKQMSRLGEGAFSVVYKVQRLADRGIYALKMVKLPSLKDKEKQNALNEVRLLASVRHENIIAYKEAFFDDKTRCLCIVMEFSDGGDLFQQISKAQKERAHLREADVWRYLFGMCYGLKALHDMQILHRDLKCANVFLSQSKEGLIAKLGDFNVSKVAKRGLCLTQTGTPYYASPEVWRDMPYDAKSDMWSIGCVLYEMVALKPPFRAEDMEGLYRKVLRGQYPRIPQHFSQDLSEVIAALLQVNPRHRPSVDQLLQMPAMRRHINSQVQSTVRDAPSDLLNTIKLPKNAIDLSVCLPKARYEISGAVEEESPHGGLPESNGDAAAGGIDAAIQHRRQQHAARDGPVGRDPSMPDSLDTYLLQQQGGRQPPQQAPARQGLPQLVPGRQPEQRPNLATAPLDSEHQDVASSGLGQPRGAQRQMRQYRQAGAYRAGREASPAPSALYSQANPSPEQGSYGSPCPSSALAGQRGAAPLYGNGASQQQRDGRRVLAGSQRPASLAGSQRPQQLQQQQQQQPAAAQQAPSSRSRGLRLPRIFG